MVARIGGDEFICVLQREKATKEKTWQMLGAAAAEPVLVPGQALVVGLSFGIVAIGDGTDNMDKLLRHADLAP
jgi:GGDEF domain-containing protein